MGEAVFYPATEALTLLGDQGPLLADRLRIYRDTWDDTQAPVTVALHERQLREHGQAPLSEVRRAADMLMIAAMFENDGGPVADANATTFTLVGQALGHELGFVASRSRRRYGGVVSGSSTDIRNARPLCCGDFVGYDRGLLDAVIAASTRPDSWKLFDASVVPACDH